MMVQILTTPQRQKTENSVPTNRKLNQRDRSWSAVDLRTARELRD